MQSGDKMTKLTKLSMNKLTKEEEEGMVCYKVIISIPMTANIAHIPIQQRSCKNHVWRNDYINSGKVCQVCMKKKEDDSIG
jgi:hypothetical protein